MKLIAVAFELVLNLCVNRRLVVLSPKWSWISPFLFDSSPVTIETFPAGGWVGGFLDQLEIMPTQLQLKLTLN